MLNLIEKIKRGVMWNYRGGIHPESYKESISTSRPIEIRDAAELVVHLQQHIGESAKLLVAPGDTVLGGQPLTHSDLYSAPPVHAPTSGKVIAIEPRPAAHPSGLLEPAVVIEPDGEHNMQTFTPVDFESASRHQLVEAIHSAGISGMGGAGFPTAIKLAPNQPIEILIINGAECEPYISADDCLMQHYAGEIMAGVYVLQQLLQPKLTLIAIEDDKPDAIAAMTEAATEDVLVRSIPTKYPSGGEKQLIEVLTGKQVPAGGIPAHIGMMVQNVGTAYAVSRAVLYGEPLTRRLVTLAGDGFAEPRNAWVDIGTPVAHLINQEEASPQTETSLIMGGPMMGFTLHHVNTPITKTSNCILYGDNDEFTTQSQELPCIRCGQCATACPVALLPQQLYWYTRGGQLDKAQQYNLPDCIECGACAYVCPSDIPLVQYFRQGKAQIREERELQIASERSRQRFENRQHRLEREKLERAERHKQATERRAQELKQGDAQDQIAKALERVKAKGDTAPTPPGDQDAIAARIARKAKAKAAKGEKSSNPAVAAAIARAKAKRAQQADSESSETQGPVEAQSADSAQQRKDAVAAAIARAKAKKAQQAEPANSAASDDSSSKGESDTEANDPRKAAVAAAIARAKAKKAERAKQTPDKIEQSPPESSKSSASEETANHDENQAADSSSEAQRKAAVAAAIARAKAKRAKQKTEESEEPQKANKGDAAAEDPRKAAVAAAIARAKAKKLAKEQDNQDNPTNSKDLES